MANKVPKNSFERNICVQDVPLLLRIVLRASQVMGAAPMRLRRVRTGWLLGVSRRMAVLQRILYIVSSACVSTAYILDVHENQAKDIFVGTTDVTNFLGSSELVFLLLVYLFGVSSATDTIKSVIALLQQGRKMNCSFKNVKYQRIKAIMLISFIVWKILTLFAVAVRLGEQFYQNKIVNSLFMPCVYQHIVTNMLQLQWSSTVVGINFLLTEINDQLEQLLIKPAITYYSVKTKFYPNKLRNETTIFDCCSLPGKHRRILDRVNFRAFQPPSLVFFLYGGGV